MSSFFRCLCFPATSCPLLSEENAEFFSTDLGVPQRTAQDGRNSPTVKRVEGPVNGSRAQRHKMLYIKAIQNTFAKLNNMNAQLSLLCRVNALLTTCSNELGAYDVRLACFSPEGLSLVFQSSAEQFNPPAATGWGYNPLYSLLADNHDYVAVLRGYHSYAPVRRLQHPSAFQVPGPSSGTNGRLGASLATTDPANPTTIPAGSLRDLSSSLCSNPTPTAFINSKQWQPQSPTKNCRTSPPEPHSLTCQSIMQGVCLQSHDVLAVPARLEGRLAAALLFSWEKAPLRSADGGASGDEANASTAGASGRLTLNSSNAQAKLQNSAGAASGGHDGDAGGSFDPNEIELLPEVLSELHRLAQFVVFGLMCDSLNRLVLTTMVQRFSSLPFVAGLEELVVGLLSGMAELLYLRFAVRLQPIFLLNHGLSSGAPALLFSIRQPHRDHQQQPGDAEAASVPTAYVGALSNSQGATVVSGGGGGSGGLLRTFSSVGLRGDDNPSDGGNVGVVATSVASRVRAVRISLHHTLLADALRAASKQASPPAVNTSGAVATELRAPVNTYVATVATATASVAGSASAGSILAGNGLLAMRSGISSLGAVQVQVQGSTAGVTAIAPVSTSVAAPTSSEQPYLPPPTIHTTIVSNISTHMLEEGAPCRDLLLCCNLSHSGTAGSLVLAVEAPSPAVTTTCSGGAASAAAVFTTVSTPALQSGIGGGGPQVPLSASAGQMGSAALPGLSALAHPLGLLHSQRHYGMYLVCQEILPAGVLTAIAQEVKQVLEVTLGACRGGALSLLEGGRCGWELYMLQQKVLGLRANSSSVTGRTVSISLGTALASTTPFGSPTTQPVGSLLPSVAADSGLITTLPSLPAAAGGAAGGAASVATGAQSQRAASVGAELPSVLNNSGGAATQAASVQDAVVPPSLHLNRRVAGNRGLVRSIFAAAAGNWLFQANGGFRSVHMPRLPAAHMQMKAASVVEEVVELSAHAGSVHGAAEALQWMTISSPEVLLEPPTAGPSPLEMMVSSMRSGVTAALTSAVAIGGSDEGRAVLAQELAALRLFHVIGRGGQGVVFYGTLHGLETAVKVIVHRGKGEPLAYDGGDPWVAADGGECAGGAHGGDAAAAPADAGGEGNAEISRIRKAKRGALELVVTGALSHPNIVQVLTSFSDVIMVRCTYRNDSTPRLRLVAKDDPVLASWETPGPLNTVVCLEFCDKGTLLEAAHAGAFRPPNSSILSGAIRPALVPLYTSLLEVALALRYLHSRRLVHCDLKPGNVLLRSSTRDPRGWTCKLSDFGCVRLMTSLPVVAEGEKRPFQHDMRTYGSVASSIGQSQHCSTQQLPTHAIGFRVAQPLGTIAYMAPESFIRNHTLGVGVDIYALGIMMYELLMCQSPYAGMDVQTIPRLVLRQHLRPEFHPLAPPEYCHLAARCWSSYASRRPTAGQLVNELEALLTDAQLKERRQPCRPEVDTRTVPSGAAVLAAPAGPVVTAVPQPSRPSALKQQQQQCPEVALKAASGSAVEALVQAPAISPLDVKQEHEPLASMHVLQPLQGVQPLQQLAPAATLVLAQVAPEITLRATEGAAGVGLDAAIEVTQLELSAAWEEGM